MTVALTHLEINNILKTFRVILIIERLYGEPAVKSTVPGARNRARESIGATRG